MICYDIGYSHLPVRLNDIISYTVSHTDTFTAIVSYSSTSRYVYLSNGCRSISEGEAAWAAARAVARAVRGGEEGLTALPGD